MSVVIERIAGPIFMKITYPDLIGQVEGPFLNSDHQGENQMTPEQVEACAQRAYEIMAANSGETAPWAQVKNKTAWFDEVRSHAQHPDAIQRKADPTLQERCVAQAYREMSAPTHRQPLVLPPATNEATAKRTKPTQPTQPAKDQPPADDNKPKGGEAK